LCPLDVMVGRSGAGALDVCCGARSFVDCCNNPQNYPGEPLATGRHVKTAKRVPVFRCWQLPDFPNFWVGRQCPFAW
jgi:hypothetical protein